MSDERRMYELEYPAPAVGGDSPAGPTLIVALQGYADAGHAVESSADHIKAALESRTVATFNNDELIDYRSRRPLVTLCHHEIANVEPLELDMRVVKDNAGTPFLLLSGPEPDLRWQAFRRLWRIWRSGSMFRRPSACIPHLWLRRIRVRL